MKITIITCFESNEPRVEQVKKTALENNYEVEVYTTDFSHIKKTKRTNIPLDYRVIDTRYYDKNLSLKRIISHLDFSKKVFKEIDKNTDLIWLMVPANSLIKEAHKFKKQNPKVKIIVDVIDMWPESLPIKINKKVFPFSIWKAFRSKYLNDMDFLVTECDYYQDILKDEYTKQIKTIYWSKGDLIKKKNINIDDTRLSLVYLGSINNLIDLDLIKEVIKKINYPVTLHIIGDGENKDNMIKTLKENSEVIYHGLIQDENQKRAIFDLCHAGINIYKDYVYIGLTSKCIDYFENGLPIINSIKGDTYKMINDYHVGVNVSKDNAIDYQEIMSLRKNNDHIIDLYNNNFSNVAFKKRCLEVIQEVIK